MPKTRVDQSRDEKVGEILEVAERRLREGGWEELSVAAIARELGVAQNAVYWYFPSKDELFVAAMERMYGRIAARKPGKERGDVERILWFCEQLAELADLRAAMNERARHSPEVADFAARQDELLSRMLSGVLQRHVAPDELPLAVESFRATVEGTYGRRLGKRERRRVLTFALERIMADQRSTSRDL
jgi:AcrR family transcriptional regulator